MRKSELSVAHLGETLACLQELLRRHRADDPFAPLTVVAPTWYAGRYLSREFGRTGLVNVRFEVLARLAELLGAPSLAAQGRVPLKPLIEFTAVRRAARQASGPLKPFREHPSFHASLRRTFHELRAAAHGQRAALERQNGIPAEILRLYTRFNRLTASYYDREALAHAAADAVSNGAAPGLDELGRVIAYLPHDLTPGEQRLLDALRSAGRCATVLGITGQEEIDKAMLATAAPRGADLPKPHTPAPRQSSLIVASDTREEVRSVARSIAADARAGIPFHRMAVLFWRREPYAALISDQLTGARVPIAGPPTENLAATVVGRMLKELVDLADGDLPREEVMRWLTSSPVKADRAGYSPSRWDALSRDAGVVAGLAQWRERLKNHATRRQSAAAAHRDDLSEAARSRLEQEANEARALCRFMQTLHDNLAQAGPCRTWAQFISWTQKLIQRYVDASSLPDSEQKNLDALHSALEELAPLGEEPEVTLEDFRAALEETLRRSAARAGALGDGVFVSPIGNAVGMEFDRVYLLGMVEGIAPSRPSEDPLLPEPERARAGLPLRAGTAAERYAYLAAASACRASLLTFARSDNIAQREQRPSHWFLEEASRLYGAPVYPSMLSSPGELSLLRKQPWFQEIASAQDGIDRIPGSEPADLHDYDLHRLWQWRQAGRSLAQHHLADPGSVLARALKMQHDRNASGLTIWDGDLSHSSCAGSGRIGLSNSDVFSPTRLETWAACPFRYFLADVLGIAALEQPEEIESISAMERGSLVHVILEKFIRAVQQPQTVPPPRQPWNEEQRSLLLQIADQAFRDAEQRGVTGKQLLWQVAKEEMRSDLIRFLQEDFKLRKKYNVSPHQVEAAFGPVRPGRAGGPPQQPVEWSGRKAGPLRFRGFIDRIDLSPNGTDALVLDYKTGATNAYANMDRDPIQMGRRLQLPVYGLAARRLLGEDVNIHVAYWFVSEKGNFKTRPARKAPLLEKMLGPFDDAVGTIADGINSGLFPANPGPNGENCRFCDFKRLCPTRRERSWRRKRRDRRLAPYLALTEGEGSR